MQLWVAILLLLTCIGGATVSIKMYRKNKKARFIAFATTALLLALATLAYIGLTFILLGGVSDAPPESAIASGLID